MKKILNFKVIIIIIAVIILAMGSFIVYSLYHNDSSVEEKEFIVKTGQSTLEIATDLEKEGLIGSVWWFVLYARLGGESIQAGVYKLSSDMGIKGIYKGLTTDAASEYFITIPEGWRITQIDEALTKKNIIEKGALTAVASANEGYLFPDTYRFLPSSEASSIRKEMLDNFSKRTVNLKPNRDSVILASIVEREAKFDEDRPKIAAVYLNRLGKGMKLEADPTIQYAKGNWEPIKTSDYRSVDSPYNTYLYKGLPPGPICNPGLKSIEAVLYPDKNEYLYFFHLEDGHAVYSGTLEEHQEKLKES